MKRIPVAILGATGTVGQRFVQLLEGHPWLEVAALAASERSVGKPYADACTWRLPTALPEKVGRLTIQPLDPKGLDGIGLVFSALPSGAAREVEPAFAEAGIAISSNASAYRFEDDVPLLVPEINAEHAALIDIQRKNRSWPGLLVTNPNCTTTGIALVLKPLADAFGLQTVLATSMQAVSGAGHPGVSSLDAIDNVLCLIPGEEEKMEREARILLGQVENERQMEASFAFSAQANRVPVVDGHTICLSLKLEQRASVDEVRSVLAAFRGAVAARGLPSSPEFPLVVRTEPDRPQPRLDRDAGGGMQVTVGRIRECPVLDFRLVIVVHNTVRGAAGGSILNSELLVHEGYVR
ncbi:aspartate-semialdehyde dehydrogenase [Candidatus Bipolaricaulota bacterium]|nr:aspartate-semialdehyde dehydrogenase [Candidatus Bipolaricaulota bacterium]TFH11630.1 MAG: aspartate-semialdehyde dehydrogenase [Candidatus Atribacteria bacterium]